MLGCFISNNMKKPKTKVKESPYFYCPRCEMDNLNEEGMMCPCPRGGCEVEHKGTITITTKVTLKTN